MSTISLRLPRSLHDEIRRIAKEEGISINQFITLATAEKLAAMKVEAYIAERARRASRERFLAAMSKVEDVEPAIEADRLDDTGELDVEKFLAEAKALREKMANAYLTDEILRKAKEEGRP